MNTPMAWGRLSVTPGNKPRARQQQGHAVGTPGEEIRRESHGKLAGRHSPEAGEGAGQQPVYPVQDRLRGQCSHTGEG